MFTDIQKTMLASTLKSQLIFWKGERLKHEQKCHSDYNACSRCVIAVNGAHITESPFILLAMTGGECEVVAPLEVVPFFTFGDEADAQEEIDRVCEIGLVYSRRNYEIIPLTSYFNKVVTAIEEEIDTLMRPTDS